MSEDNKIEFQCPKCGGTAFDRIDNQPWETYGLDEILKDTYGCAVCHSQFTLVFEFVRCEDADGNIYEDIEF
ncbi:MAG: hypothetical protein AAF998_09325 [Bacteroidota bacterium]